MIKIANANSSLEYQDNHTATVNGTAVTANTFIIAKDMSNRNSISEDSNIYGISGANIEIDLSGGSVKVEEESINTEAFKQLIQTSPVKEDTRTPYRMIVDLKRIEHVLTLNGWLVDDTGNITNAGISNTALNKKKALCALQESGSTVRFYFRNEAFSALITKCKVDDDATVENVSTDAQGSVAKLKFTIQLWVGKDRANV